LHFSICARIDEIYTGARGTYWRAAYDNQPTGSTFFKKLDIIYDPDNLVLYKIYVKYSGIYTCQLEMEEICESDGCSYDS
jgi:hypothetical protein